MSRWLTLSFLLMGAPLWAQFPTVNNPTSQMKGTVQVAVVYPDGTHAGAHLHVQLRLSTTGTMMGMDSTSSAGTATFEELNAGYYNLRVSGDGIEDAESGEFAVEDGRDFQTITVMVKPVAGAEPGAEVRGSVAAVDLNVPKKAAKEYSHAGEEMSAGNWAKAIDHLDKAIVIYPQYSAAYNDLGVCYGRLKQEDKQRAALVKAISVNDHCIPALINLAHMQMQGNQLADALVNLNKALAAAPANVNALGMLVQVEFLQGHYELAVVDARKAHGLPHHAALIHYTAASALQRENLTQDAMVELELFLQEEPQGPRAQVVRKVLGEMARSQSQASDKVSGEAVAGAR